MINRGNSWKVNWLVNAIVLFYVVWWIVSQIINFDQSFNWWSYTYCIIAGIGGVLGLEVAQKYGGFKSLLGRTVGAFSIGLLLQTIGQIFGSYYVYLDVSLYPSWADVGFFGSIFLYVYGSVNLAKVTGVWFAIKQRKNQLIAALIFIGILVFSYYFLLRGIEYDPDAPLLAILDFGYPLGQAVFVSFAFVTFFLTRGILGGLMRKPMIFFLLALIIQFLADYTFSFLDYYDLWTPGGYNDFMYFIGYALMTYALISTKDAFDKIKNQES